MIKTYNGRKNQSIIWSISKNELSEIVRSGSTFTEILKHFNFSNKGGNCKTLKNRLIKDNIDFSHIKLGHGSNLGKKFPNGGMTLEECMTEVFVKNSMRKRSLARTYLKKYNLLEFKCKCGIIDSWQEKPISLQLEHKNGIENDHRLENLEWLCPNCHSQTKTFSGRRKKYNLMPT